MAPGGINDVNDALESSIRALMNPRGVKRVLSVEGTLQTGDAVNALQPRVSVSSYGRDINEMQQELSKIEDEEERQRAYKGLREIIHNLGREPNPARLIAFVRDMVEKMKTAPEILPFVFATAGALVEVKINVEPWINTLVSINDSDAEMVFLKESRSILNKNRLTEAEKSKAVADMILSARSKHRLVG